jgi:hypothetical protein
VLAPRESGISFAFQIFARKYVHLNYPCRTFKDSLDALLSSEEVFLFCVRPGPINLVGRRECIINKIYIKLGNCWLRECMEWLLIELNE